MVENIDKVSEMEPVEEVKKEEKKRYDLEKLLNVAIKECHNTNRPFFVMELAHLREDKSGRPKIISDIHIFKNDNLSAALKMIESKAEEEDKEPSDFILGFGSCETISEVNLFVERLLDPERLYSKTLVLDHQPVVVALDR